MQALRLGCFRVILVTLVSFPAACARASLTPLAAAARTGDTAHVRNLIAQGADPALGSGVNDWSPLLHAVHVGRVESVRTLLEFGGPRARFQRDAALEMAVARGSEPIAAMLLADGADARRPGLVGAAIAGDMTPDIPPYDCAGRQRLARTLLRYNPDLAMPSGGEGWFLRRAAMWHDCRAVIEVLTLARPPAPGHAAAERR